MIQTGLKQATIAYRVAEPTGEPLDINGALITVSGRKQAIALLVGTDNPNPDLYEVQAYFNSGDLIDGERTAVGSSDCQPATFTVTPTSITLSPDSTTAVITVSSSTSWHVVGDIPPYFTLSQNSGTGDAVITVTRTATFGASTITFASDNISEGIPVAITNLESTGWILETGFWRDYKLWKADGIWNY